MIRKEVKQIVKQAMEMDIENLRIFTGYDSDQVIEVVGKVLSQLNLLESFAKSINLECRRLTPTFGQYQGMYVIYIAKILDKDKSAEGYYQLK